MKKLIKLKQPKLTYDDGKPVILNEAEQYHADYMQRYVNERFANVLGYEVPITTLSQIVKKISKQKFFEIPPADYLPVVVGEGAWNSNLVSYREFNLADDFSTGIINTAQDNARLATATAGVDDVVTKIYNWAKANGYTVFDLEISARSGNWDIVAAKERSRKKNWDLGVQKVAFLGMPNVSGCLGLLNLAGVTTNTTRLTSAISGLSTANLRTFCINMLNDYRENCQRTAWPTHFIIPESDYLGLAAPASADFPIRSTLSLLEETFQIMTKNKNFKVLPLAYGDAAYNAGVINGSTGKQCYVFLNYDEESLRMNIPVDYTNTMANSIDNFSFQNVGYGQFTGVTALRTREVYYYQF